MSPVRAGEGAQISAKMTSHPSYGAGEENIVERLKVGKYHTFPIAINEAINRLESLFSKE